ncbi:MAG: hypothetical protein KDD52_07195, partial [Bdellovibrionales bacterium]|nr:hypothetical protein [Bdellovibrionales bacterium]
MNNVRKEKKMKKLTFLMVAMSFVVVFSNQVQADMKVAVFDAQKVIDNIDEGKSAVTALEKEAGEKKKLMEKKQKELLELKSEIDRGA